MATISDKRRTIDLKRKGHRIEGTLDTVATPGMHVQYLADSKYDISPAAVGEILKSPILVVLEDLLRGKTVTDAYAIADRVFLAEPLPGDELLLLLKSGETPTVGGFLSPEGGGTGLWVVAAGTEFKYAAKVLELNGSGACAANVLVRCEMN